jgi:predicted class III extradiol MEMO1 family dioxygenase
MWKTSNLYSHESITIEFSNVPQKVIEQSSKEFEMKFLHYSQSSQCKTMKDSSVSYASGVLYFK